MASVSLLLQKWQVLTMPANECHLHVGLFHSLLVKPLTKMQLTSLETHPHSNHMPAILHIATLHQLVPGVKVLSFFFVWIADNETTYHSIVFNTGHTSVQCSCTMSKLYRLHAPVQLNTHVLCQNAYPVANTKISTMIAIEVVKLHTHTRASFMKP